LNNPDMADTHLILPPAELQGCVRAFIARDKTRGGAPPRSAVNHFPAAPFCAITWFITGQAHLGDDGAGALLDRVVVSGPLSRPLVTWNPAPVHAFMVVLYPDAFQEMTGAALPALADQLLPLRQVLAPAWHGFADAVLRAASDGERLRMAQSFLCGQWQPVRRPVDPGAPWLRALQRRLQDVQRAIGERQFERKVKQLTGQSMQALRRTGRLESALLQARGAAEQGALDWSRVAVDAGYADQPHLCREVRRLAGAAPSQLLRHSQDDDGYWLYRHWRGSDAG
jgi:AraC-like DNA-binding protein